MLGSITDSFSSLISNFASNFISQIANLAPNLMTGTLSSAANAVLPGSGALAQAFFGPIIESGMQGLTTALRDALTPAASQASADSGLSSLDIGSLVNSLGNTFLDGVRQGLSGG